MPSSPSLGRRFRVLVLAVVAVAQTASGQSSGAPSGTAAAHGEVSSAVTARASVPVIGLGDRVLLRVWEEPTWSDSLLVGPDGGLVLPRIGRLHVAGMDQLALRDTIQRRLAAYLRDPSLDLVVLRRVAVLGAVKKPDVYYVDAVSTLRDVIAHAGGLAEDANPNRVEISHGGERKWLGRLDDVVGTTMPVQSGDEVQVGRRSWLQRNAVATISSVAVAVSVLITALRH
jgi:protein involved in polysaccharide export with SLBB domain